MCKGANDAVMAEMNYDWLKYFIFDCRPSLLKTADFFLSGLIVGGGRLLATAFSNSIRGRIA